MSDLEKKLAIAEYMIVQAKLIANEVANAHCACENRLVAEKARKVEGHMAMALAEGICIPGAGGLRPLSGTK